MLPNWLYGKSKSKLASILGGGGGAPADYNQVKAQVEQNTENIVQLTQDSVTWDNLSEVGAVNQLLIKTSGDTTLSNGVYGTHNSDNTITLHGTATSNLVISVEEFKTFKAGTYKLSGAPSMGSSDSLVELSMRTSSNTVYGETSNDTDGVVFTLPTDTALKLVIYVKNGTNVEGKVVKPMLTPASYNGPYVPPAKTNKELTDDVADIAYEALTDYGSSEYTLTEGKIWQTKGVTFLYIAVTCTTASSIESGNHIQIATIPSKFKKPQFNIYPAICNYRNGSSHIGAQLQIQQNGVIAIRGGEGEARYCGLFSY